MDKQQKRQRQKEHIARQRQEMIDAKFRRAYRNYNDYLIVTHIKQGAKIPIECKYDKDIMKLFSKYNQVEYIRFCKENNVGDLTKLVRTAIMDANYPQVKSFLKYDINVNVQQCVETTFALFESTNQKNNELRKIWAILCKYYGLSVMHDYDADGNGHSLKQRMSNKRYISVIKRYLKMLKPIKVTGEDPFMVIY